jgi:hypothetical protein
MFDDSENHEGWRNPTLLLIAGVVGVFFVLSLLCIMSLLFVNNNALQPGRGTAMALATQQYATIQAALTATKRAATGTTTTYETTDDPNITPINTVGKIEVEYPVQMLPVESGTVLVHVSVPSQLVDVNLETLTRIPIPASGSTQIEGLSEFSTNILVAERMSVVLSSPTFQVEDLIESTQTVHTGIAGWITSWAWTITAPKESGTHVFTIRVYLLDDTVPAWLGSFNVIIR